MADEKDIKPAPPEFSPYLFPVILAGLGFWCLYDGWFSTDPDMQEHLTFNRVLSVLLLVWAAIDFYRTRKADLAEKAETAAGQAPKEHDN